MMAELSFKKKLCRYLGIKAAKQANARATKKEEIIFLILKYAKKFVALTKIFFFIFTFVVEVKWKERGAERIQTYEREHKPPQ